MITKKIKSSDSPNDHTINRILQIQCLLALVGLELLNEIARARRFHCVGDRSDLGTGRSAMRIRVEEIREQRGSVGYKKRTNDEDG